MTRALEEAGAQLAALLDEARAIVGPLFSVNMVFRGPTEKSHMLIAQDDTPVIIETLHQLEANVDKVGYARSSGATLSEASDTGCLLSDLHRSLHRGEKCPDCGYAEQGE